MKIHNLLSNFPLDCLLSPFLSMLNIWITPQVSNMELINPNRDEKCHEKLSKEEVKLVMERLGIRYEEEGSLGGDEYLAEAFEEEPSLEEVKEAFDVFDENKDGFIDATELQRVLRCLGMKEGLVQLEECTRIIRVADEDEDGRINFHEFVKFMETTCFC